MSNATRAGIPALLTVVVIALEPAIARGQTSDEPFQAHRAAAASALLDNPYVPGQDLRDRAAAARRLQTIRIGLEEALPLPLNPYRRVYRFMGRARLARTLPAPGNPYPVAPWRPRRPRAAESATPGNPYPFARPRGAPRRLTLAMATELPGNPYLAPPATELERPRRRASPANPYRPRAARAPSVRARRR
jgi:hypothetical protein